jgi:hypothetical protein
MLLPVNPEFQRLLWLEFNPVRLIAMPLIVLAVVIGVDGIGGLKAAAYACQIVAGLLVILWGSRLAAESFGEEVTGRTWDLQRLSSLNPWSVAFGKILGGAAYAWYGMAFCVGLIALLARQEDLWTFTEIAIDGAVAQAAALLAVMVLHRLAPSAPRGQTTAAQLLGLVVALELIIPLAHSHPVSGKAPTTIDWYGYPIQVETFTVVLAILVWAWIVFAIQRLVRREFGQVLGPLGWSAFTIFAQVLALGAPGVVVDGAIRPVAFAIGAAVAAITALLAAFATPITPVDFRRLGLALRQRDPKALWTDLPPWVPPGLAVIGLTLAAAITLDPDAKTLSVLGLVTCFGFFVRDLALIHAIRLSFRRRTTVALVILFGLLYAFLPNTIPGGPQSAFWGLLVPPFTANWALLQRIAPLALFAPWFEAALCLGVIVYRVRSAPRAQA